jgi:hypothetical protein
VQLECSTDQVGALEAQVVDSKRENDRLRDSNKAMEDELGPLRKVRMAPGGQTIFFLNNELVYCVMLK